MAAEVVKPNFNFQWASGGAIVAPSDVKIQTGWGAEVPPFQWENFSQNRQDNAILHLFQKGISVWSATDNYYFTVSGVRSYVQGSNGSIYVAVQSSLNQNPVTDTSNVYWKLAFIDLATLTAALTLQGPVIGISRNARMPVPTAAATATFTADQVIVSTSLTGTSYRLNNFSKSINLATTGVGGMDTGSAPVSGYVGIYAIYNPTTQVSALLAVNATAAAVPEIYGGANMPAGYTASALVSVWGTTAASLLRIGNQFGRRVNFPIVTVVSTSSVLTNTAMPISTAAPRNAIRVGGDTGGNSTSSSFITMEVFTDAVGSGRRTTQQTPTTSFSASFEADIAVIQTIYVTSTNTAGTPIFRVNLSTYEF